MDTNTAHAQLVCRSYRGNKLNIWQKDAYLGKLFLTDNLLVFISSGKLGYMMSTLLKQSGLDIILPSEVRRMRNLFVDSPEKVGSWSLPLANIIDVELKGGIMSDLYILITAKRQKTNELVELMLVSGEAEEVESRDDFTQKLREVTPDAQGVNAHWCPNCTIGIGKRLRDESDEYKDEFVCEECEHEFTAGTGHGRDKGIAFAKNAFETVNTLFDD